MSSRPLPPKKMAKTSHTSAMEQLPAEDNSERRAASYPSFSQDHLDIIHQTDKPRSTGLAGRRMASSSSDLPAKKRSMVDASNGIVRPMKTARPSPPAVIEYTCVSSQRQGKPSAAQSAKTSFATTNGDASFLQFSRSSQAKSFVDTPASSFGPDDKGAGGHHDLSDRRATSHSGHNVVPRSDEKLARLSEQEIQENAENSHNATVKASASLFGTNAPNHLSAMAEDCENGAERKSLMSGFSQESQLIRLDNMISARTSNKASKGLEVEIGNARQPRVYEHKAAKRPLDVAQNLMEGVLEETKWQSSGSTRHTVATGNRQDPQEHTKHALDHSLFEEAKSPFDIASLENNNLSFRTRYEVVRVALAKNVSPDDIARRLDVSFREVNSSDFAPEYYNKLWNDLLKISKASSSKLQRSRTSAWMAATGDFKGLALSGKLAVATNKSGLLSAAVSLSPLRTESTSTRVARKYGADRLFQLDISEIPHKSRDDFSRWLFKTEHYFLNRYWRAFFAKQNKEKDKNKLRGRPGRVYMFATRGDGLDEIEIFDMLDSFLAFKKNKDKQPALKLFSRIALLLTDTHPGPTLGPDQIIFTEDACSCYQQRRKLSDSLRGGKKKRTHEPGCVVMNDGASRISLLLAQQISHELGLSYTPPAFQGRINGAKGIWIVEFDRRYDEEYKDKAWIEICSSQAKFRCYRSKRRDDSNYIFEVHGYPRPLKAYHLNDSIIPILHDRGVPEATFKELLEESLRHEISDVLQLMEQGGAPLYQWIHSDLPIAAERMNAGCIKMSGAWPATLGEEVISLLDAGCHPLRDRPLFVSCKKILEKHCNLLEQKTTIDVPRSTFALMVPDHMNVLEVGQVHIAFSRDFRDPDTDLVYSRLDEIDVLVARFPSYLPSDVQKVRAVYKPELAEYKDVIFFSTRCKQEDRRSLAEYLSGGDYDGDKAFVCWEPRLVDPFENAPFFQHPEPSDLGIKQNRQKASEFMLQHNIDEFLVQGAIFNLAPTMLGMAATWYGKFNYAKNSIREQMDIGAMLGLLVDAPKQGYIFSETDFLELLDRRGLKRYYRKPYYKCEKDENDRGRPTSHILDVLIQHSRSNIKAHLEDKVNAFGSKVSKYDITFSHIFFNEKKRARERGHAEILRVIQRLEDDIEKFVDLTWGEGSRIKRNNETRKRKTAHEAPEGERQETYSEFLERARAKFLLIEPLARDPNVPLAEDACVVERWRGDRDNDSKGILSTTGSWIRLKASMLYELSYQRNDSKFPWLICGRELCQMKADSLDPANFVMVSKMRYLVKPDRKLVEHGQNVAVMPERTEEEYYPGMELHETPTMADVLSTAGTIDDFDFDF